MRCSAAIASFAALISILFTPALASELPSRKPGLWQMKMSMPGQPMAMPGAQHCIDAETDKLMSAAGSGAGSCTQQDVRREGGAYVIESVCKMGPTTTRTRAVASGDFNSAYKVDVASSSGGAGETRMTIEATWLGACKAGQKPGDIIMGNGMKMNVRDLQNMQNYAPGAGQKR